MKGEIFIPNSLRAAGRELRLALACPLNKLSKTQFVRAWCSVVYLFPGLHPDGFEDAESGWPRALKQFVSEAWRRAEQGEFGDEVLYPCDAQWCGLHDRMTVHPPDESERRFRLGAVFGQSAEI